MADTLLSRMGFGDPDLRNPTHDEIVLRLLDPEVLIQAIMEPLFPTRSFWKKGSSVQTEAPLKNGRGFLVGFADLLARVNEVSKPEGRGAVWHAWWWLIEVKTSLPSFGEVMRQIAVYRECVPEGTRIILVAPPGVIADHVAKAFRSQGVYCQTFDPHEDNPRPGGARGGEVRQGLDTERSE